MKEKVAHFDQKTFNLRIKFLLTKMDIINEAFFWKHLADTLLEKSGINKGVFYRRIKPVKSEWDVRDVNHTSEEIKKVAREKTSYIKESFGEILSELKE